MRSLFSHIPDCWLRNWKALDRSLETVVKLDMCAFRRAFSPPKVPGRDDEFDIVQPDARREQEKFLDGRIADGKAAG